MTIGVLAVFLAVLLLPSDAYAWGAAGHLAISRQIADSLLLYGPHHLASLIAKNYQAFLLGSLSPDIFSVRDWFMQPSRPLIHGWDLAHRLVRDARGEEETAYSLGYISHLASDVICHNFFIPQYIFMCDHSLKITHLIAETRAEGYIGSLWTSKDLKELIDSNSSLDGFFARTAGLKPGELERNKRVLKRALSLKVKTGVDSLVCNLWSRSAKDINERIERHISLSVKLSLDSVRTPFSSKSLGYCPEGIGRINLSRIRRRLFIRLKSGRHFKRQREAGKFDYIHSVPEGLIANTI
ncbi:MAG: zinc dependent phospholipase C family protein [Deltaproteobacteria bacterium]|nr:zinc dependent phospholipase C family protein [Deltaproteobacteria bacterium]